MYQYPKSLNKLIEILSHLPGIGPKSAERIALFLLRTKDEFIEELILGIKNLKKNVKTCKVCFNLTENDDTCSICKDNTRDKFTILVVEDVKDLIRIESLGYYKGVYHVLGGHISTSQGLGIEHLTIDSLEERVKSGEVKEIIFALSPQWEGDITKEYIKKILKKYNIKISSLARGISGATYFESIDDSSLIQALIDRKEEK
ncbi:MAG: recombination mediator RecR [Caldisericia bacterium]|jgi:recombination protein RecR|nr:recombination mediator RecR [Caldisericia bacterium]